MDGASVACQKGKYMHSQHRQRKDDKTGLTKKGDDESLIDNLPKVMEPFKNSSTKSFWFISDPSHNHDIDFTNDSDFGGDLDDGDKGD
jgi:hypothetical protein